MPYVNLPKAHYKQLLTDCSAEVDIHHYENHTNDDRESWTKCTRAESKIKINPSCHPTSYYQDSEQIQILSDYC